MQEHTRYAVGIDIGTSRTRAVVAHIDQVTGVPTIVGVGDVASSGMRKGEIVKLTGPAQAIDDVLAEAERASGHQVNGAVVSINGTHILSTHADGMIAVGSVDHEISVEDLMRLEEVSTVGKIPPNREILDVIPHKYRLDGQDNVKDPIGMTGTRLELDAHVISAMGPQVENLKKALEMAKVHPLQVVTPGMAAARSVLSESQLENGVGLIDIGAATTNIAVYEEGDLQFTAVLPYGGVNVTNDLAIGLKISPELAEEVKLKHAVATGHEKHETATMKLEDKKITFDTQDVDDIVEARLDEIFELIQKLLKKAGYAEKLPNGVVLVGGTANMKKIDEFAKQSLNVAAEVGKVSDFGGVDDKAQNPAFATAVGLMLTACDDKIQRSSQPSRSYGGGTASRVLSVFKKAFGGGRE